MTDHCTVWSTIF